jgi:sugar transferase (PEP-CTERM/EpsH1 system associated)
VTPGEAEVPLVVHVIFRLDTGGMENGLVNLINRTPVDRYRHAIVCLTDAGEFARRITRPDVAIVSLQRPPGHSFLVYFRLWRVLRQLGPSIVHTRNLAALECQIPAAFLRHVKRVHGEHGRDIFDLHGRNRRYNALRRAIRPLVHRYIAVSLDLEGWLREAVGVSPPRIRQIYNGVAVESFQQGDAPAGLAPSGFLGPDLVVVGTVGRLAAVKDQGTLVRAVATLVGADHPQRQRLRLVIAGDGPSRLELEREVRECGLSQIVWFAGDRTDVPEILRLFDIFVLPSLGEGISNTILEAMATGLPVVATRVGGTPEIVTDGLTGTLVPPGDAAAMALGIDRYLREPELRRRHGMAGREVVTSRFTWGRCVAEYLQLYDELLTSPLRNLGARS